MALPACSDGARAGSNRDDCRSARRSERAWPQVLNRKGSLYLTRPSLGYYLLTREELLWRAGEVLSWVAGGKLKLRIARVYPLAEAAAAHRDLESRKTAGKLVLAVS